MRTGRCANWAETRPEPPKRWGSTARRCPASSVRKSRQTLAPSTEPWWTCGSRSVDRRARTAVRLVDNATDRRTVSLSDPRPYVGAIQQNQAVARDMLRREEMAGLAHRMNGAA